MVNWGFVEWWTTIFLGMFVLSIGLVSIEDHIDDPEEGYNEAFKTITIFLIIFAPSFGRVLKWW